MTDGVSLELRYFSLNELRTKLDERAKIIIKKHLV